jgi:hypothetical protein
MTRKQRTRPTKKSTSSNKVIEEGNLVEEDKPKKRHTKSGIKRKRE